MNSDLFITCAVTGAGPGPKKSAHVPVTPVQIAEDVLAAADAGAAIAHIHVRDPETTEGCRDVHLYAEVLDRVRDRNSDVIVNFTAGMGGDYVFDAQNPLKPVAGTDLVNQRTRMVHVEQLRPDICTLDCGSYNVGEGNVVYLSSAAQIREGAEAIRSWGVKPELEVFDLGHLDFVMKLMGEGAFAGPTMVQFCLGVNFGAPATTEAMKAMADATRGSDLVWSAFGVGRMQMPMVAQAALLGGNIRVGLEDNIWLERGAPATNVSLVMRAREIVERMGARVMSARATRDRLGLGAAT